MAVLVVVSDYSVIHENDPPFCVNDINLVMYSLISGLKAEKDNIMTLEICKRYYEILPTPLSVSDESLKLPTHVTLHGLCHTNASLLSQSGLIDITSVSENLGHTKVSTTENYYLHSDYETKQEIAKVLEDMLTENQA